jgi:hypothetical protein
MMVANKNKKHRTYASPKSIHRRRQRDQTKWKQLFEQVDKTNNIPQVIKHHPEINLRTLQRRYAKYKQQNNENTCSNDATIDHRNQYRQIFTPEQEQIFASHIRNSIESNSKFITKSVIRTVIRTEATLYYNQIHQKTTRNKQFHASDGWISRFKARHHFTSHRTKVIKRTKDTKKKNYLENEIISFKNDINEAILDYDIQTLDGISSNVH